MIQIFSLKVQLLANKLKKYNVFFVFNLAGNNVLPILNFQFVNFTYNILVEMCIASSQIFS